MLFSCTKAERLVPITEKSGKHFTLLEIFMVLSF